MDVLLKDSDLVSLVLGFLHSRQLYESALALERETGCLSSKDNSLPDDLQFLRQLALDGKWDLVLSYLEPFTHLDEFNTKTFYYLVLRQRYFESLHSISLSKSHSPRDTETLKAILEDVRPYCSPEEFQQLSQARNHSDLHDWSIVASRYRCFNNILMLIGPLYEDEGTGPTSHTTTGERWWMKREEKHAPSNDQLLSLITDSLLYNECSKYCRERATGSIRGDSALPLISSQSLHQINNNDSSVNAALVFWLRSLNNNNLFQQPFEEENVEVKIEQLKKRTTPRDLQNVSESTVKLSSFASPVKPVRESITKHSPALARSLQLPPTERVGSQRDVLSSSGPAHHHSYNTSRNRSNNNNNASDEQNLSDATLRAVASQPLEQMLQNVDKEKAKQNQTEEENSSLQALILGENGDSNKLPIQDVNDVQKEVEDPEGMLQEEEDVQVIQLEEHQTIQQEDTQDIPSKISSRASPKNPRKRIDNNSSAKKSSKFDSKEPSNAEIRHSIQTEGQADSIKVQDSYAQFLEENKRMKMENQNFLKDLEKTEKRKDEIRRMLAEQNHIETGNGQQQAKIEPSDVAIEKDVNENHQKSPKNQEYVPVEFVEDVQAIRAVSFHPSGMVYAVGSNSKTLRICEVPRDVVSRFMELFFTLPHTNFSRGSLSDSSDPKKIEMKPAKILLKKDHLHKGSIYCMTWNEEGSLIATGSNDKLVKVLGFDVLEKSLDVKPLEMSYHRGIVREVLFLQGRGNMLASAGGQGTVYITDCAQNKVIHQMAGHTDDVLSLYSWHHGMLASSSQDKSIRLWDIRTARCVSIIGTGSNIPSIPTSICVDNGERLLAMGLDNHNIGLYDLTAGKMALEFKAHNGEVRSVRFNPVQTSQLLSSSYDGTIALTDVMGLLSEVNPPSSTHHHVSTIAKCTDKVIQCRWHPNGEDFASTSVDKTCKLWHRV